MADLKSTLNALPDSGSPTYERCVAALGMDRSAAVGVVKGVLRALSLDHRTVCPNDLVGVLPLIEERCRDLLGPERAPEISRKLTSFVLSL